MNQKRIVSIQDISCFGKCSLTVSLPIISAMGLECCVLPTSVLSSHTAYPNPVIKDLTDNMEDICNHWKSLGITFDGILSGYLASYVQLDYVKNLHREFKTNDNFIFVDPVMGDHGKLYKGFDGDFVVGMKKLCCDADVIMPNMTEASFMLGIDFVEGGYSKEYVIDILKRLCDFGCKKAVLTGVRYDEKYQGAVMYNSINDEISYHFEENQPHSYYGTGDIFASVLSSAITLGYSDKRAIETAIKFTVESIRNTEKSKDTFSNIKFEAALGILIDEVNKDKH